MEIKYPEIGICGLSCRLCPSYHTDGTSRCGGCKSQYRMDAGCPFITCAVKRKGIEFCWQCAESDTCGKWAGHRAFSQDHDTFVCYQTLEDNIAFIKRHGVGAFACMQLHRETLLKAMLKEYNEGRSKRYYSIATNVMEIEELEVTLTRAHEKAAGLDVKEKSRLLHSLLDKIAEEQGYILKLRK